jgi:hypothetical protein
LLVRYGEAPEVSSVNFFAGMKLLARTDVPDAHPLRTGAFDRGGDCGADDVAGRVELVLPETGVCSRCSVDVTTCCGEPAPAVDNTCCVADAFAKQHGK